MTTTPHQQECEHDGKGAVWRKGSMGDLVHQPTPGHAQSPEEVVARGALIAAAPDMARLLLGMLERAEGTDLRFTMPGLEKEAREILKLARVLPQK